MSKWSSASLHSSGEIPLFARGEKIADVQKKDTSIEELTKMIVHD